MVYGSIICSDGGYFMFHVAIVLLLVTLGLTELV